MRERTAGVSPGHLARIAGGLFVIIIVAGFFAIGWVPAMIIVPGNVAATAHNIVAHELLYQRYLEYEATDQDISHEMYHESERYVFIEHSLLVLRVCQDGSSPLLGISTKW